MEQIVIEAARIRLEQLRCELGQLESAIREAEHVPLLKKRPRILNKNASKRVLSPEARQRIVAAQKKRWAAFRKEKVA